MLVLLLKEILHFNCSLLIIHTMHSYIRVYLILIFVFKNKIKIIVKSIITCNFIYLYFCFILFHWSCFIDLVWSNWSCFIKLIDVACCNWSCFIDVICSSCSCFVNSCTLSSISLFHPDQAMLFHLYPVFPSYQHNVCMSIYYQCMCIGILCVCVCACIYL